ncbi:DUF2177 family protein [Patescibacteria group bacterium]|nr:DUF2177 family protein [Patescibacteria group bacterium]MCG2702304.1 DUF2177 family protein [Candidatus Parcubacteria bacterium]MBU4264583.1 DUF2177 family protein [Patescibacteria group bacterium]MBU4390251.1 DUF2177 family protein [Patescibacteria group bacterium]MBU4397321.1 DUF2177 family protein [Patescibacteria group bacterium]
MFIKTYLITLPVFLAIDLVWLSLIARKFYAQHLGYLMKTNVNFVAAGLFYLLFVVGLVIFSVLPALEKNSWTQALFLGALLGLISYATYDLTNLATIKDWPLVVTIVDMVWGTVLGTSVSLVSYFIVSKI